MRIESARVNSDGAQKYIFQEILKDVYRTCRNVAERFVGESRHRHAFMMSRLRAMFSLGPGLRTFCRAGLMQ